MQQFAMSGEAVTIHGPDGSYELRAIISYDQDEAVLPSDSVVSVGEVIHRRDSWFEVTDLLRSPTHVKVRLHIVPCSCESILDNMDPRPVAHGKHHPDCPVTNGRPHLANAP